MATDVKLPRLGQGMESGTIVKWLKAEGDSVEKGEPLYELDTEKVTQEVEAEASGVLLKIAVEAGEVEVGRTVAVIGEQGEAVPSDTGSDSVSDETGPTPAGAEASDDGAEQSAEKPAEAPAREPERERGRQASADVGTVEASAPAREESSADGARVKASPLARRIARERGIELDSLSGTGPEGRIVAEDVERAAAAPAAAAPPPSSEEVEVEQLSSLRRTVARRMTEAWQAPAFQISMSADMTRALALRERLVELAGEGGTKPTVSDVLTRVCAAALSRHPAANAHYAGDSVRRFGTANIGIAVATERGLIVPVITGAERMTIAELAAARGDLVGRARSGKLKAADLEGGTFTISNLGMYGVEQFVAVLNPPQAAILAVGAAEERPVAEGGKVVVRPTMTMTLTCDHRSIDGAAAADFLRTLKTYLEEPGLAL
ncbi:MAG: 2-oxo acid dehydrogenase subunit E2 [Actinobacteria bacterium]|nr:2-oxo acid dehydrogenase subunit E2 [Actinomycetota bacterium]